MGERGILHDDQADEVDRGCHIELLRVVIRVDGIRKYAVGEPQHAEWYAVAL